MLEHVEPDGSDLTYAIEAKYHLQQGEDWLERVGAPKEFFRVILRNPSMIHEIKQIKADWLTEQEAVKLLTEMVNLSPDKWVKSGYGLWTHLAGGTQMCVEGCHWDHPIGMVPFYYIGYDTQPDALSRKQDEIKKLKKDVRKTKKAAFVVEEEFDNRMDVLLSRDRHIRQLSHMRTENIEIDGQMGTLLTTVEFVAHNAHPEFAYVPHHHDPEAMNQEAQKKARAKVQAAYASDTSAHIPFTALLPL